MKHPVLAAGLLGAACLLSGCVVATTAAYPPVPPQRAETDPAAAGVRHAFDLAAGPLGLERRRLCVGAGDVRPAGHPQQHVHARLLAADHCRLGMAAGALDVSRNPRSPNPLAADTKISRSPRERSMPTPVTAEG